MKLLLPAFALLLLAPPAGAAEIGRLFFTPVQRTSLDKARAQRVRTAVATEPSEEAPAAAAKPPVPEVVTYGGVVKRSDGRTTVWINNRALTGKEIAGSPTVRSVRPDGSVTLQAPQSGRDVSLQVGQRAELLSGTVQEGYLHGPAPLPGAAPAGKPDAAPAGAAPAATPAADAAAAGAERRREEREQREQLDDAIRALKEAAAARSGGTPGPQPGTVPGLSPK